MESAQEREQQAADSARIADDQADADAKQRPECEADHGAGNGQAGVIGEDQI